MDKADLKQQLGTAFQIVIADMHINEMKTAGSLKNVTHMHSQGEGKKKTKRLHA